MRVTSIKANGGQMFEVRTPSTLLSVVATPSAICVTKTTGADGDAPTTEVKRFPLSFRGCFDVRNYNGPHTSASLVFCGNTSLTFLGTRETVERIREAVETFRTAS